MHWLHPFSNLDRSRFVRRDRSSPVKKNVQIFLVIVGVVTFVRCIRSIWVWWRTRSISLGLI